MNRSAQMSYILLHVEWLTGINSVQYAHIIITCHKELFIELKTPLRQQQIKCSREECIYFQQNLSVMNWCEIGGLHHMKNLIICDIYLTQITCKVFINVDFIV